MTNIARLSGSGAKDELVAAAAQAGWTKPQLVRLTPGEAAHSRALHALAQTGTRAA